MSSLQFTVPTPLEYFRMLVQSDDQFPLLEAVASLAEVEYPGLDLEVVLGGGAHGLTIGVDLEPLAVEAAG